MWGRLDGGNFFLATNNPTHPKRRIRSGEFQSQCKRVKSSSCFWNHFHTTLTGWKSFGAMSYWNMSVPTIKTIDMKESICSFLAERGSAHQNGLLLSDILSCCHCFKKINTRTILRERTRRARPSSFEAATGSENESNDFTRKRDPYLKEGTRDSTSTPVLMTSVNRAIYFKGDFLSAV